jgi:hypothetical protein
MVGPQFWWGEAPARSWRFFLSGGQNDHEVFSPTAPAEPDPWCRPDPSFHARVSLGDLGEHGSMMDMTTR